jgi:hypothetical protein
VVLISSMTCALRSTFVTFAQCSILILSYSQRRRDYTPKSPRTSVCLRLDGKGFSDAERQSCRFPKARSSGTCIRHPEGSCAMFVSISSSLSFPFAYLCGSGNISPYSSGAPGASLTSTSVDPQTATSRLVWDEVCTRNTVNFVCFTHHRSRRKLCLSAYRTL